MLSKADQREFENGQEQSRRWEQQQTPSSTTDENPKMQESIISEEKPSNSMPSPMTENIVPDNYQSASLNAPTYQLLNETNSNYISTNENINAALNEKPKAVVQPHNYHFTSATGETFVVSKYLKLPFRNNNKMNDRPGKRVRVRTAFTDAHLRKLEEEYSINRYLEQSRRQYIAKTLNLTERTVKIWFQNRRMKEKREKYVKNSPSDDERYEVKLYNLEPNPVTSQNNVMNSQADNNINNHDGHVDVNSASSDNYNISDVQPMYGPYHPSNIELTESQNIENFNLNYNENAPFDSNIINNKNVVEEDKEKISSPNSEGTSNEELNEFETKGVTNDIIEKVEPEKLSKIMNSNEIEMKEYIDIEEFKGIPTLCDQIK